jgi:branched-chain amino acid transport system substrate-binding protein
MKKTIIWVVIIVVVAGGLVWAGNKNSSQSQTSESIKIGAILPLTDFGAFWGEMTKAGMNMAVEDLRKEGYEVELVFEDSKGKADMAVSAAQKLLASDKVDVLYTDFSGPSSAVAPIANNAKKVFVYSAFDPGNLKTNEYALKTFFDAPGECKNFSNYLKQNNLAKKIAYLGVNLPFTEACVQEIIKVFGKENVIVEAATNPGEVDFRSSLLKVKGFGADFILSFGYEPNYKAILTQKGELGIKIPMFCTESDCYTDAIKKTVSPSALEGSVFFDYSIPQSFLSRITKTVGEGKNYRGVSFGYDVIQYIVRAAKDCGGASDPACLVKKVSENKSYKPMVPGDGFNGGRVFIVKSEYNQIKDGQFVKLER